MHLAELPHDVQKLLERQKAPARLIAHLRLVHDVACRLNLLLEQRLPLLEYDRAAVAFGAATHDIGKAVCPAELSEPGNTHEEKGRDLLLSEGFPFDLARFAFTHGGASREPNPTLEDLLVRTADAVWKGKRESNSEMELVRKVSGAIGIEEWLAFSLIDGILTELADDSDARLQWQFLHAL